MDDALLNIEILPEDFKNAPYGYHNGAHGKGCVLWQALHRLYPEVPIEVGAFTAKVDNKYYKIDNSVWGPSLMALSMYPPLRIDTLSEQAKISLEEIPTVPLTLTFITAVECNKTII